ncbi:glutamate receptor-like [Penaeus japonicus]|uniref:glutamate receptor-like n=1 Tax=Penaeus japonicus TaxID=27405 RepID=UPI001C70EA9E|nr:glutamate receptor-like [Penaeus japonicus]
MPLRHGSMKMGLGVHAFVFFCLSSVSESQAVPLDTDMAEARFIQDYVMFYNFQHVCVVSPKTNSWLLKTIRQLGNNPWTITSIATADDQQQGGETDSAKYGNGTDRVSTLLRNCEGLRVMKLRTGDQRELFRQIYKAHEFPKYWLLVSHEGFSKLLATIYLPLTNRITVANLSADGEAATLAEVYQVGEHLQQNVVGSVGRWTSSSSFSEKQPGKEPSTRTATKNIIPISEDATLDYLRALSKPKEVDVGVKTLAFGTLEAPVDDPLLRRRDLTGLHLVCATIEYEPLTILKPQGDGSMRVEGVLGKVFDALQEVTNFTYTCHRSKDGQWGSQVNGEWTGMIKEVKEGSADIAIAPLTISKGRSTAVTFLLGIIATSQKIVLKRPTYEDYMWTVYTKQFEPGVWGVLLFVVVFLAISLYYVSRFSSSEVKISVSDALLTVFGFMFGQGTPLEFQSASGRTLVMTVLLLQVLALAFYTCNMVSALTVGPPLPPYKDLRDIHKESSITFGFVESSSNSINFRRRSYNIVKRKILLSRDSVTSAVLHFHSRHVNPSIDYTDSDTPLIMDVWQSMKGEDFVQSAAEGIERVLKGKYAFMEWEIFYTLNYGHICEIVLDLLSGGLLTKWWEELKVISNDCTALETAPIELKTVLTPFLLLVLSMSVAFSVLVVERLASRSMRGA